MTVKENFKTQSSLFLGLLILFLAVCPSYGEANPLSKQKEFSKSQLTQASVLTQEIEEDEIDSANEHAPHALVHLPLPSIELKSFSGFTQLSKPFFFLHLFSSIASQAP